ncbi:hypothetical protein TL16_g00301 [Triparma laevis f. inornata]|uniref:Uncharacterized protein n=1 Tax=Triparma laevis f. inornata TaxID=1714386 RepID=A0A9W6ZE71_9STRA|nr:hypothetical protein TL16_g00301 [Triparma laevis f. inornata]
MDTLKDDSGLRTLLTSAAEGVDEDGVDPTIARLHSLIAGFSDLKASLDENNARVEEEDVTEEKHDREMSEEHDRDMSEDDDEEGTFSVVIIGASASGLGVACALLQASPDLDVRILEKSDCVGSTFLSWPSFTTFISPSFYSNPFGPLDLNQITPSENGPQTFTTSQHPTGKEYAEYLQNLSKSKMFGDRCLESYITFGVDVSTIETANYGGGTAFNIATSSGTDYNARYVIYAGALYHLTCGHLTLLSVAQVQR